MDFATIGANIIKLMKTYWKVFLIDGVTTTLRATSIAVSLGVILAGIIMGVVSFTGIHVFGL